MKYSSNFLRDFNWYLSVRHLFSFDGKIPEMIEFNPKGLDGRACFHKFDSTGKLLPSKHPNIVACLLRTKGSVNLHIKMYAEDRAYGRLPSEEFDKMCDDWNAPDWFWDAVEKQRVKFVRGEKKLWLLEGGDEVENFTVIDGKIETKKIEL